MVEGVVEDETAEGGGIEHACNKGLEFNITVVEGQWDGAGELELVGLEIVAFAFAAVFALAGLFCAGETADYGT